MATTKCDATAAPGSRPASGTFESHAPTTGELIGRCRVLSRIATGGMAIVYKVMHEELEVVRAVKLLKPDSSQEWCDRLRTEAKISAHLHHPNIVQIYNVDIWRGTLPYIEMEYVDGPSLDAEIAKRGRLPAPLAVALTCIVCNALHFAQNRGFRLYGKLYSGLVHRDIKPANILMTSSGTVKLADFGIAQPGNVSLHTVGSHVLGTYAYLSPEQLGSGRVDQRSDIYSLGLVLYEMVTGQKAFPQRTIGDLVQDKLRGAFRPVKSLAPDLSRPFAATIERCLSLRMADRFESAEELGRALQNQLCAMTDRRPEEVVCEYMGGEVATVKPVLSEGGARRQPWWWIAASMFGVAAVAAMILLSRLGASGDGIRARSSAARPPAAPAPAKGTHDNTKGLQAEPGPPQTPANPAKAGRQPTVRSRAATTPVNTAKPPRHLPTAPRDARKAKTTDASEREGANPDSLRLQRAGAYLESGDTEGALALLDPPVHDGYYYLLVGKCHHEAGRFEEAESAFGRAQTTPSRFAGNVRGEAVYRWAVNRSALYARKPNAENRNRALKAWRSYRDAFCTDGEERERCRKAREAAASLAPPAAVRR